MTSRERRGGEQGFDSPTLHHPNTRDTAQFGPIPRTPPRRPPSGEDRRTAVALSGEGQVAVRAAFGWTPVVNDTRTRREGFRRLSAALGAGLGCLLCLAFALYGDLAAASLNAFLLGDQRHGGAGGLVAEQVEPPVRVVSEGGATPPRRVSPGAGSDRPAPFFTGGGR